MNEAESKPPESEPAAPAEAAVMPADGTRDGIGTVADNDGAGGLGFGLHAGDVITHKKLDKYTTVAFDGHATVLANGTRIGSEAQFAEPRRSAFQGISPPHYRALRFERRRRDQSRYPEEMPFQNTLVMLDTQLVHATKTADPSTRTPDAECIFFNMGEKSGASQEFSLSRTLSNPVSEREGGGVITPPLHLSRAASLRLSPHLTLCASAAYGRG